MPGRSRNTNLAGAHERLDIHAAQHIIIMAIINVFFLLEWYRKL